MGDKPFIKFYPGDFLAGTSGLSPAERGVYITLLCLIYEADRAIPRDDSRLARRCGAPKAAFKRILMELIEQGKITERSGMLSNDRAEKALMDRANRTQIATHAANSRWGAQGGKTQQNQQQDDAGAMQEQCSSDASQSPEPEYTTDDSARGGDRPSDHSPTHRENLLSAMGVGSDGIIGPSGKMIGRSQDMLEVEKWTAKGISEADQVRIVAETMRAKRDGVPPSKFSYFNGPMSDFAAARDQPMPAARPKGQGNGSAQGDTRDQRIARWEAIAKRAGGSA